MKPILLLIPTVLWLFCGMVGAADGELKRRALLGALLAEVGKDQRREFDLKAGGVVLKRIVPDSSAAEAKLRAGDIVVKLGGKPVPDMAALLRVMSEQRAGDRVVVNYVRDGEVLSAAVRLKEKPREEGKGYDVIYGSVTNGGFRQRTIITRPRGSGRHPAVLFLQGGHTCFAVDDPFGHPGAFVQIAQHLARNGYVTMRIERPGCGDSEGGPLRDIDFDTELAGNQEAVRALKRCGYVDPDKVLTWCDATVGRIVK